MRKDLGVGRSPRRGATPVKWLFALLVLAALLGGGAYAFPQALPEVSLFSDKQDYSGMSTHTVQRNRLLVTVVEEGNVESASNIDVKCQLAGGGTILWIVEDGSMVKKGDELVRLDPSTIEDQLNAQKIAYNKALATKIQAEQDFAAAKIAVKEYVEGTFVKELQTVDTQITIAMENLRSAENILAHTRTMARKGFATPLQLEADEFSVERAKLELDAANTAKKVLTEFTREKTIRQLEAARDSAEAKMKSEDAALELEKAKLTRLEDQLKNCVIIAPQDGMVVYANEGGRWGQQTPQVEEGAAVRDRQTLIRLPDLSKMQVKVTVHESKVDQIRPGMPARITILDRDFPGKVVSVANQPEPTSWFSANVKEYATIVSIDGETEGLKPGMTAAVEILIADVRDALTVPVSSVVEQRGKFVAWVLAPQGPERRPLVLGLTDDKFLDVKDGLKEGEQVLLNPRAVVAEARTDDGPADADSEREKAFGEATTKDGDPATSPSKAGEQPQGGPPGGGPQPGAGPGPVGSGPGAGAPGAGGPGAGGPPGADGSGGAGGGRSGARNLMQFDQDGDKKISRDEAPEWMQGFFDRIDGNSDGFVDAAEMAEMRKRFEQRRGGAGGPGDPGAGGPGGGGPGGGNLGGSQ